jgi:hypothetical protein
MVATAGGLDSRLLDAAQALLMAGRGSPSGQPMSLPDFLRQRCQQLLAGYATTAQEDERLLEAIQSGTDIGLPRGVRREQLLTAAVYRLGKKRVLHTTLAGLN